ncbi:MAG: thiol reductant ABC exporter subunit CydD [Deltaproteobacteria bacterium]|nr:MAG: thiol reductant ABC exporter subunit CydD [Deltaproteobacteria bacterium]
MNKKQITRWLKGQIQDSFTRGRSARFWLINSIGFGLFSGILIIIQAKLIAYILAESIVNHTPKKELASLFLILLLLVAIRAVFTYFSQITGYSCGESIRRQLRQKLFIYLKKQGLSEISKKPAGAWNNIIFEQVEEIQDFFAKYLPQMILAGIIPLIILSIVFPLNWAAGLIFMITAPLIPFFMIIVGMKAADANKRNFIALQRLSGSFLDRLSAMVTIRIFNQMENESNSLAEASEDFRIRTMQVLKLAFLSSAILEFFTAISIALAAVYFGFSYLDELHFGTYGNGKITLLTGLFILILAPEFFQPLRDLGTYYHAKAKAIGAAESIFTFLKETNTYESETQISKKILKPDINEFELIAKNLVVMANDKTPLTSPLDFSLVKGEKLAITGKSGAGKTSLINAIMGFLPYQGSLTINGMEISEINHEQLHQLISWIGQNPLLLHGTIRENVLLARPEADENTCINALSKAQGLDIIKNKKDGINSIIGDRSAGLSVGQAQRIALARAIVQNGDFWILDEPTASLDKKNEELITSSLKMITADKTALIITHRLNQLKHMDKILVMDKGKIIHKGNYEKLYNAGILNPIESRI